MSSQDYRRALIMMRSLLNGYSGHARVEIRKLTGSLSVVAVLPPGNPTVQAALVGKRKETYFAWPLGTLRRDLRGQAGLNVTFDPRDVGGRTLDAYAVLTLIRTDGVCEPVLVGNLDGARDLDWQQVRETVCALYRTDDGVSALPNPEETAPEPLVHTEPEPPENVSTEIPQTEAAPDPTPNDEAEPPCTGCDASEHLPICFRGCTKVPLPRECGFEYACVAIDGEDLWYALPASYTPEPPAGLEDYQWAGDGRTGWWVYHAIEP